MFAWLCLRMRYPQNSNGLYMIIYDVPCDNDYLMGYLVYPIFRHTHIYIYQDMILHKTSVGCALYTIFTHLFPKSWSLDAKGRW